MDNANTIVASHLRNAAAELEAQSTQPPARQQPSQVTVEVPSRKAVNNRPLYLVRYTSNAGNTKTYGVFWEGTKDNEHRVGLRKMLQNGSRLSKYSRYNKGFFVAFSKVTRIESKWD